MEAMERERPLGITILAIVGLVVGGWHLFLTMFALTYVSSMVLIAAFSGFPPELKPAYASTQSLWQVLVAGFAAAVLIVGACGLWMMERWGYWMAVAGAGLSLLAHILPALQGVMNGTSTFSGLLAAAVLTYLLLPGVRRAFFEEPANAPLGQA
jgi:hypothetical protein